MQEHHHVVHASVGDDVGIPVTGHAREHDTVHRLECDDVGSSENDL